MGFMMLKNQLFRGISVLIVEDQAEMRVTLKSMMDALKVGRIDILNSGEDVLTLLKDRTFDLILCDYDLGPGIDGRQILEEGRASGLIKESTSFVMVTGVQKMDQVMGALEHHPDGYISKPFTLADLQVRLGRTLIKKNLLENIHACIDQGELEQAIQACDDLVVQHEKFSLPVSRIKAKLLMDIGRIDEARAIYEEISDSQSLTWATQGLAKCLFLQKNYDDAQFLLETLVAENNTLVESFDLLAQIHEANGSTKLAQSVLMEAVEVSAKSYQRQESLARLAHSNEDWDTAARSARKALSLAKHQAAQNTDLFFYLAKSLQSKLIGENFRDRNYAISEITKVLSDVRRKNTINEQVHLKACLLDSLTHKNQGKYDDAKKSMMLAKKIFDVITLSKTAKPTEEMTYDVGQGLVDCNETEQAISFIENALEKGYIEESNLKNLSEVLTKKDEQMRRVKLDNLNNKGVMHFERGEIKESLICFRKAAEDINAGPGVLLNAIQAIVILIKEGGSTPDLVRECQSYFARCQIDARDKRILRLQKLKDLFLALEVANGSA
jgi:DNA-binding response OmpR family regulator